MSAAPDLQPADDALGLRAARRLDASTVRLSFGPSFVPAIGSRPETYRFVSSSDPAYKTGVRAASVQVASAPDGTPPPQWQGKRYLRYTVTVTLPRPLRPADRYFVQALGFNGQPVTGGRAAAWLETMDDAAEQRAALRNGLGVRRLELIAPTVVVITAGDGVDVQRLDGHAEAIVLRCATDPDFKAGRPATRAGRRTRGECYYTDGWPYGFFLKQEIFAVFDKPLKQGQTYSLDLNAVAPLTVGRADAAFTVDDRTTINPALKVNQIGYLPEVARKYAYLGAWMGSLGAFDYALYASRFEVRDAATHRVVFTGQGRLRHTAREQTETLAKADLSGENVTEFDLSPLRQPGRYYIAVPGAGRSYTFRVAGDVYAEPFRVMMNGVYHQRCGIELTPPDAQTYRPACHRNKTELTDLVRGTEAEAQQGLPKHVISPVKYDLYGGYHDAGDYDPRSHIEMAELAFLLYECKPRSFWDGQLPIPEAHNGVPDILDVGRWELDLWTRLQDTDGGVRGGIEANGDPNQITLPEEDTLREFAFAKEARASLAYAGCAAQASFIWTKLGRPADAKALLDHAVKAWTWAFAHDAASQPDQIIKAAIQLYRASGEAQYLDMFHRYSVFKLLPQAQLDEYQKYDQQNASFYYALCERPVDPAVKAKIVDAFKARMTEWMQWADTAAYRFMKQPYAPLTWGTGAHPKWLVPAIEAYTLTKDPAYLQWITLTCDFALGCNPMNTVFTTRLGQRPIWRPLHMLSRYSPDGPIAGIQCEGPSPKTGGEHASSSMDSWIGAMLYPPGPWPPLQTYTDVGMSPGMNEGVVVDQMNSAVAYGFLLPER